MRRQEWLELEATSELTRGLLSGRALHDVLTTFAERVGTMAEADLTAVALPDPEAEELIVHAVTGAAADRLRGAALQIDASLLGSVFKFGKTQVIADAAVPTWSLGPAILVPLGSDSHVCGVLAVARVTGGPPFDASSVQLVEHLAVQTAVVLELADRRREGELVELYADRDRIARDLHDLAIQRLFATSMSLQAAHRIAENPAVAERISQAISDLDDTIKVIRSTIFALHTHDPAAIAGPRAEIIEACERAADQLGFAPSVRFSGPVDTLVPDQVAEHLVAVLREALSNAARHAAAAHLDVHVAADATHVTLTVLDDGIGLPAFDSTPAHRSGLANLAARARELGGHFTAEPRPDGGTVLVWSVPV